MGSPPCRSCPLADASGARCAPPRAPHVAPCGHTTFLAAREACYPAAGRHQIVSPTLGETICWASVHLRVAAEKPIAPDFVPRGERSARRKKNFFLRRGKKIFFLPKKFFSRRKFFFLPEKISASENFFAVRRM